MSHRPPPSRYRDPFTATPTRDLRRFAWLFVDGDPTPLPGQGALLGRLMWEGDALADAWIAHARGLEAGVARRLVDRAIREGIDAVEDAPEPLRALFAQVEQVPVWLDRGMLALAHQTYRRGAMLGELVLTQVSLMGGYRHEGPVRPLVMTGRLDRGAERRTAETAQFIHDVTALGALERGGAGYEAAVRVRLLHARVRRHLSAHRDWDHAAWGLPICQTDMVGTNLLFSAAYLWSMKVLGMRYSAREARSVIHLWRYVGLLMGVRPELLPADEQEAARLSWLIGVIQSPAPPEVSRVLGEALHGVPMARAREGVLGVTAARAEQHLRAGVSRFFFGHEACDALGLPRTPMTYAPLAMIPVVRALEVARGAVPGGTRLAAAAGAAWERWRVGRMMQKREALYSADG